MKTITGVSQEIHCESCASSIRRALSKQNGIAEVIVDVPARTVTVSYDEAVISLDAVAAQLDAAGFAVRWLGQ